MDESPLPRALRTGGKASGGGKKSKSSLTRKLTISHDDPFAKMFIGNQVNFEIKRETPSPTQIEAHKLQKKFTKIQRKIIKHGLDSNSLALRSSYQNQQGLPGLHQGPLSNVKSAFSGENSNLDSSVEDSSVENPSPSKVIRVSTNMSLKKSEKSSRRSLRKEAIVASAPPPKKKVDEAYKNSAYWSLPDNVRKAIDGAKQKSQHSDFYYRLQNLNDKIYVFRTIFYNRIPNFQKTFNEKKKKQQEEELRRQRELYEEDLKQIQIRIQKKKLKRESNSSQFSGLIGYRERRNPTPNSPLNFHSKQFQLPTGSIQPGAKRQNSLMGSTVYKRPLSQRFKKGRRNRNPYEENKIIEVEEQDSRTKNSEIHESAQSIQGSSSHLQTHTPEYMIDSKRIQMIENITSKPFMNNHFQFSSPSSSEMSPVNRRKFVSQKHAADLMDQALIRSFDSKNSKSSHGKAKKKGEVLKQPSVAIDIPKLRLPQEEKHRRSKTDGGNVKSPMVQPKSILMKKTAQNSFKSPLQLRLKGKKKSDSIGTGEFTIANSGNSPAKGLLQTMHKRLSKKSSFERTPGGSRVHLSSALANSSSIMKANLEFRKRASKQTSTTVKARGLTSTQISQTTVRQPTQPKFRSSTRLQETKMKTVFKKRKTQIDDILNKVHDLELVDSQIQDETLLQRASVHHRALSYTDVDELLLTEEAYTETEPIFDSANNIIIRHVEPRLMTANHKSPARLPSEGVYLNTSSFFNDDQNPILFIDNRDREDSTVQIQKFLDGESPLGINRPKTEDLPNFQTDSGNIQESMLMDQAAVPDTGPLHTYSQAMNLPDDDRSPLHNSQTLPAKVTHKSIVARNSLMSRIRDQKQKQLQLLYRNQARHQSSCQQFTVNSSIPSQPYTNFTQEEATTCSRRGVPSLRLRKKSLEEASSKKLKRTSREASLSSAQKSPNKPEAISIVRSQMRNHPYNRINQQAIFNQWGSIVNSEQAQSWQGSLCKISSGGPTRGHAKHSSVHTTMKHAPYAEKPNFKYLMSYESIPRQDEIQKRKQFDQIRRAIRKQQVKKTGTYSKQSPELGAGLGGGRAIEQEALQQTTLSTNAIEVQSQSAPPSLEEVELQS